MPKMKNASKKRKSSASTLDETTLLQHSIPVVKQDEPLTAKKKSSSTDKINASETIEKGVLVEEIVKASLHDLKDLYSRQLEEKPFLMLGTTLISGYLVGRLFSPRKKLTRFLLKRLAKMMGKQALRYALSYLLQSMIHSGNTQTSPNKGSI